MHTSTMNTAIFAVFQEQRAEGITILDLSRLCAMKFSQDVSIVEMLTYAFECHIVDQVRLKDGFITRGKGGGVSLNSRREKSDSA